jgi:hypothetical protein
VCLLPECRAMSLRLRWCCMTSNSAARL